MQAALLIIPGCLGSKSSFRDLDFEDRMDTEEPESRSGKEAWCAKLFNNNGQVYEVGEGEVRDLARKSMDMNSIRIPNNAIDVAAVATGCIFKMYDKKHFQGEI